MKERKIVIGVIVMMTLVTTFGAITPILAGKWTDPNPDPRKGPVAITGDNVYVAWWTNKTVDGNEDVIFRASTDKGQTFGDKINLSNTTDGDSTRVEIDSDANSVVVTWWETNDTSDMPVMKVSTDNGNTFGPLLKLGANGTLGSNGE